MTVTLEYAMNSPLSVYEFDMDELLLIRIIQRAVVGWFISVAKPGYNKY